jgi:hypothetical protein
MVIAVPQTQNETLLVSNSERRIFCLGKKIEGLRGDVQTGTSHKQA